MQIVVGATMYTAFQVSAHPHFVNSLRQGAGLFAMDDIYDNAREQFFTAIRILATSPNDIQTRLIGAYKSILLVTIDEFAGDLEMKLKFARILDELGPDTDDLDEVGVEAAAHMPDADASRVAEMVCDFFYDLG